jgi:hypothetical protein
MFAAEPDVGNTSRVMSTSGATKRARSSPILKYVPLSDAVTILYSIAAWSMAVLRQSAKATAAKLAML